MKRLPVILLCLLTSACASVGRTLKYGYLPGSDYKYYSPLHPVDLQGHRYKLVISDSRMGSSISCSKISLPRDPELEGARGYTFFTNYVHAMIEANNGIVDAAATDGIEIKLRGLSGELRAIVYGHVWGLIEFKAKVGAFEKTYCSAMVDGDEDAPVGEYSLDTRKDASRKMVSGSTRRALEEFVRDLAHTLEH